MLYQVVLRLARNPGFPEGDEGQGYVLIAPLDTYGKLDAKVWRLHRDACTVTRFKHGEERDASGMLDHRGSHWFFDYQELRDDDDEPVFRLGDHKLTLGEYVTVRESDGKVLTYRVTQCSPWKNTSAGKASERGAA